MKEIAPSDKLRQQFCHDPKKWLEFKKQYHSELASKPTLTSQVRQLEEEKGTITLLYSAKLTRLNNAVALKQFLEKKEPPRFSRSAGNRV